MHIEKGSHIMHNNAGNSLGEQIEMEILRLLCERAVDGEELKQDDLAELLGVSRTPVREALSHLHHDGYAMRLSNRHVCVYSITADYLTENIRLLAAVELQVMQSIKRENWPLLKEAASLTAAHMRLAAKCVNPYLRKTMENMVEGYFSIFCERAQMMQETGPYIQLLTLCKFRTEAEQRVLVREYFEEWIQAVTLKLFA